MRRLYPLAGRAHLIGITGPPGSGKSTLVAALIAEDRARGGSSRSSRSIRRARSPAAPCSATGCGCRPTRATTACSSARWRPVAMPAGWRQRRPPRRRSWMRRDSTGSSSRPSAPGRARSRWRPLPTPRSCSRRPRWVTRSRRSRPACSRSPTSWWSTRATSRAPRGPRPSFGRCWSRPRRATTAVPKTGRAQASRGAHHDRLDGRRRPGAARSPRPPPRGRPRRR